MKKLSELREIIRTLIESELDDELNTIEVGDIVDVDAEYMGTVPVRVLELVDDVREATGVVFADDEEAFYRDYVGPGFVGEIDSTSGESGRLVFSLKQVVPGSKMRGYFPKLGDEYDEDEYGRPTQNPYRQAAKRFSR